VEISRDHGDEAELAGNKDIFSAGSRHDTGTRLSCTFGGSSLPISLYEWFASPAASDGPIAGVWNRATRLEACIHGARNKMTRHAACFLRVVGCCSVLLGKPNR
jgi:hypothetical protein